MLRRMNVVRTAAPALAVLIVSAVAGLDCKRSSGAPYASAALAASGVIPPPLASSAPLPPGVVAPLSPHAPIEDERNTISVFRETAASAVFITQRQLVVDPWEGRATEVPAGSGSGFVWDTQGHVVTNFHVVAGLAQGGSVTVTLHDQSTLPAEVRGVEPRKDIAVLKVRAPAEKLVPIRLHDKKDFRLEVGQKAVAIGNPFGLDHTLTVGVVSALGRSVDGVGGVTIRDMVQTDAAINPGNSGGPLLDSSGRLIGMNTAIFSKSGASAGVGFAVPASTIQRVVPQIIRTGRAEQVGIGIGIDPNGELERRARVSGVIVRDVPAGTAAARAGLQGIRRTPRGLVLGDVIIGIDQHRIENYDDLYNTLDSYQAGQKVTVKVRRGNEVISVPVELSNLK